MTGGFTTHDEWLIACVALAIAGIVAAITLLRVHPLLALLLGSAWVALAAGVPAERATAAFQKGVGDVLGSVGMVLALGTLLGATLSSSGAADHLVSAVVERTSARLLPWAVAGVAVLVGIPMFFEVGLVLLVPILAALARRTGLSLPRVGFPALAALSVCHGLIPPHPGPLIAAAALHADLGRMLAYGLLVAAPTVAVAGPLFGPWIARRLSLASPPAPEPTADASPPANRPGLAITLVVVLLPIALMLARTLVELDGARGSAARALVALGHPLAAMTLSVIAAGVLLPWPRGERPVASAEADGAPRRARTRPWAFLRRRTAPRASMGLESIATMLVVIGAGGGFKQTLIESGIGSTMEKAVHASGLPLVVTGWLLAVAIRVATGSATVATVTASGILAPLAPAAADRDLPLLALSVGCGSLFFSHVNDAGFWLVKELFGLSVSETLRSWSIMETIISVFGLACLLVLGAFLH